MKKKFYYILRAFLKQIFLKRSDFILLFAKKLDITHYCFDVNKSIIIQHLSNNRNHKADLGLLVLMMYSRISSMITAYLPILDAKKQKLRVSNTKKIMLYTDLFVIPTPYIISHTKK